MALFLFIIAAFYGLFIRINFVYPIKSFEYNNFVQGHSHVAFLGWGYIATIGAILHLFVANEKRKHRAYNILMFIILVCIVFMLLSFPLSGYKVFSIALLAVFGITSYILSFKLLKDINGNGVSEKLIKYGIYYYLLSSLATWFLAGVIVTVGKTDLYYNTVYFYLHFLYNGFFVFALFGVLFKIFENQHILISKKLQKGFFIYLNVACIPAFALSILWSQVASVYYVIGFAATILQLISLFFLMVIYRQASTQLNWSWFLKLLLKFSLLAYGFKIIIQIASAFPFIVEKSLALKPFFIIGYLHLFTLAFMSVLLFLILDKLGKLKLKTKFSKIGMTSVLLGILSSEVVLFLQGYLLLAGANSIANYSFHMIVSSGFIVLGLLMVFASQFFEKPSIY